MIEYPLLHGVSNRHVEFRLHSVTSGTEKELLQLQFEGFVHAGGLEARGA